MTAAASPPPPPATRTPAGLPSGLRHGLGFLLAAGLAAWCALGGSTKLAVASAGAFLATWVLVPALVAPVRRLGAVVLPGGREEREEHIPLLGGIAIYLVFAGACVVASARGDMRMVGLLVGTTLLVFMGLVDDLRRVRPRQKILVQVAAGLVLVLTGWSLPSFGVPGLMTLPLGWLEMPILLFWIVLATNAFNVIDGMDGLATTVGLVTLGGLLVLGVQPTLVVVLAGAMLGFLPYNLPRAKMFLGDAGSMSIGFVLAALLLRVPGESNLVLALGLFAYPLGDTAFSVLRRYVRGKPLFAADRSHLHHKLLQHLGDVRLVLPVVVLLALLPALLVLLRPGLLALLLLAAGWGLLTFTLVHLGRVRLQHLFENRHPFQALHLLRQYVEGSLRIARQREDVRRALVRLQEDLGLARIELGDLVIGNGQADDPRCYQELVGLSEEASARWCRLMDPDEEAALALERRTVVADVLREAHRRLETLERRAR